MSVARQLWDLDDGRCVHTMGQGGSHVSGLSCALVGQSVASIEWIPVVYSSVGPRLQSQFQLRTALAEVLLQNMLYFPCWLKREPSQMEILIRANSQGDSHCSLKMTRDNTHDKQGPHGTRARDLPMASLWLCISPTLGVPTVTLLVVSASSAWAN